MDISELQLKINKNQAVQDLQAVEGQLGKTGKAADGLLDTLKNIGLTVGFGKLVKDSLAINSTLGALDMKFKSIFTGGFDTQVFKDLKNELTLSDSALKGILSTTGAFAKGLGQSSQYVQNFSMELTKAAADYATYLGKNTSTEMAEMAKKFGKATLGEVGELKDIGIVVDTTSNKFKEAVKAMQEATGATEAQAKQMEIQRQIMEQVQIASGAASTNMYDGWAQLNKLFDQFKEILGDVGSLFSTIFAPALKLINDFLSIPFIKSTAGWLVAVVGVGYGYTALLKTLRLIRTTLVGTADAQKLSAELQIKAIQANAQVVAIKKEELKLQERIAAIQLKLNKNQADMRALDLKLSDRSTDLGRQRASLSSQQTYAKGDLAEYQQSASIALNEIGQQFKDLGINTTQALAGLVGLDPAFIGLVESVNGVTSATKALTGAHITGKFATLGAAAAEKVLAFTRGGMTAGLGKVKNVVNSFSSSITTFFTTLAGGATGFAAVKGVLGTLAIALGKVALIAGAALTAFDALRIVFNQLTGEADSYAGTVSAWLSNVIYKIDQLEEEGAKLTEANKKMFKNMQAIAGLQKELEQIHLDEAIKKMLPAEALKALQEKSKKAGDEVKQLTWIISNFSQAREQGLVVVPEDTDAIEYKKTLQEKLNNLTREYYGILSEVEGKTKDLKDVNKQYAKAIADLTKQMDEVFTTFAYGYDVKGKFGNYTDEEAALQRTARIKELQAKLTELNGKNDLDSLNLRKDTLQEIFNLTKDNAKYELDALWKQRETLISNQKAMGELLKQATSLRQTAQNSVAAGSMEALRLQSRRFDSVSKNEMAPMVEQQKQIKEIERQMLQKQGNSEQSLQRIYLQLVEATKKIGKGSGASDINVVAAL